MELRSGLTPCFLPDHFPQHGTSRIDHLRPSPLPQLGRFSLSSSIPTRSFNAPSSRSAAKKKSRNVRNRTNLAVDFLRGFFSLSKRCLEAQHAAGLLQVRD
jgi:hypothetical protein